MENKIQITAKTVDEFNVINSKYLDLPYEIKKDIISAKMEFSYIWYEIGLSFDAVEINIPKEIDKINITKEKIIIYTEIGAFFCNIENKSKYDIIGWS